MRTYEIAEDGASILCLFCRRRSYHPEDVKQEYCGACKVFHEVFSDMIPTKLYTREGEYVATVLVPPFQILAEILVWGERTFVYDRKAKQYREGLAYVVVHPRLPEPNEVSA